MQHRLGSQWAAMFLCGAGLLSTAAAQGSAACLTQGSTWWNNTSQTNLDPSILRPFSGRIWRPGGAGTTPYLAVPMGGKALNIYNVSSPATPSQVGSFDLWGGFLQTIQTYPFGFVSVVDGQTIGYASFTTNGYVIFRFDPATSTVTQLYKLERNNTAGLSPAHLVMIGGQLYLVGRVPTLADGETYMSGFSVYSVDAGGTPHRVSGHDYSWSMSDNVRCFVVQSSDAAHTYVYVQNGSGMDIWDISTPAAPTLAGSVSLPAPSFLVRDGSTPNLAYFDYLPSNMVTVVDLSNPAAPVARGSVPVPFGQVGWAAALDGLVYLPLSSSTRGTGAAFTVSLPPTGGGASVVQLQDQNGVLTRPPVSMELPQGAAVYKANGLYYLYREELGIGDVITVDPVCLSTTPVPLFTVTDNAAATCTPVSPQGTVVAKAFPDDKVTIANTSTGSFATATLAISYYAAAGLVPVVVGQDVKTTLSYTWDTRATAPAGYTVSPPGEYQVLLTLTDASGTLYTLSKSVWLCGNPQAALAFGPGSSANMLVGETVNLSAASTTGNPTGYTFLVTQPNVSAAPLTATGATASYVLPQVSGTYGFTVISHYDFAAAANDPNCLALAVPSAYLPSGVYNSCVALSTDADYGVSAFEVMQNGQVVVPSGGNGAILADQGTTLRFTGRVASGYAPNFIWSIANVSSALPCNFTAAPYTGTTCPSPSPIAAGTWPAGSPVAMNMSLQVCPSGSTPGVDCGASVVATISSAPTTTVTPQQVSATLNATPGSVNIGQAVTFSVSNLQPSASSFSSLTLNLPPGAACNAQTTIPLCPSGCATAINSPSVTFQNTSGAPVTYTATLSGVTEVGKVDIPVLSSVPVTVGTTGSCTTTVTLAATPNPTTTGTQVTFTVSPGVTSGISSDQLTIDFGDGATASINGSFCGGYISCNSVLHTYTTASTFQASVSGTLGGVNAATPQPLPVTVNQATTVTVTLTPSPNPASVGSPVTFSFSPWLTRTTDTLTFNFGDNTTSTVTGQSGTVSSVTHTFTAANTYTVQVSGSIGGATAKGSTTIAVQSAAGGSLAVAVSPNPASVGATVSVTFSPALSQSGDSVTLYFGDGTQQSFTYPYGCSFGVCGTGHVYTTANSYTVSGSGTVGGKSMSGSTTLVVSSPCSAPTKPTASFTYAAANLAVQFTDASTGGATSWAWNFGDGGQFTGAGTSTQQNPSYTYANDGTYTVTLTATNCQGSSVSQQAVTVSSCTQSAPPTASFTWPTGAVTGFPEQQQPYAGQQVTLTDTSTNAPTQWSWNFGFAAGTSTAQNPVVAFPQTGAYTVTLTATNCKGASTPVPQSVTVNPDVRHVVADFTWSGGTLAAGSPVTLTADAGPTYGDPDTFVWTFDDGTAQQSGASITHTFACGGTRTVALTASRSNYAAATATTPHTLTLTGQPCGPEAVMTVDAANVAGLAPAFWRTDVRVFNPSSESSNVTIKFLPINQGSPSGPGESTTLAPHATWVLDDILGSALAQGYVGTGVNAAALRLTFDNAANAAPVVVSNTYSPPPSGVGREGESTPGIEVVPNTTPPVLWITGIRNTGTTAPGFRTNYSVVNLRSDAGLQGMKFTLFNSTGTAVATKTVNMNPLDYWHDSLAKLFDGNPAAVSPDPLALKVDVPAGADVQAFTSLIDNGSLDPVLIPAVSPATSPIFLPAVGHTVGVPKPDGSPTLWRTDLQITNPDSVAHTWEVRYWPKGQPYIARALTLAAGNTQYFSDLLSWVYNGGLGDTDSTAGLVRVAPADGSSVFPIIEARSFSQGPDGTYGSSLTPISAKMGIVAGQGLRLALTGMSSSDIARSSLGFVNLSDTGSVNFEVTFYDEGGNVLNPLDGQGKPIPYTVSLGVGGWDQDLLENRFKNTPGWQPLGANNKVVSAVIEVTGGGPGMAYATITDWQTGDPFLVLAQVAP